MASGFGKPGIDDFSAQNRHLTLACKRVNEFWFPANLELLDKITRGLAEGVYDLNTDFLHNDIAADFGLFTFCLKNVISQLRKEGITPPETSSSLDLFRMAGPARLSKILSIEPERISSHALDSSSDAQIMRLRESMISASTAEVLADKGGGRADTGYMTGLLRQLGVTLVAWNYPLVYQRVFSAIKPGIDLDMALTRELGFSPTLLGIALAREWNLAPEIRLAIGEHAPANAANDPRLIKAKSSADNLVKICEVGEALARANDPQHYPEAKKDWEIAKQEIETRLGHEGISLIKARIRDNCESYLQQAPDIFKDASKVEPEAKIEASTTSQAMAKNRYIPECPPRLQEEFRKFYGQLDPAQISRDNILFIAQKIVPLAGFKRGCVYVYDPETVRLVPRLKIGEAQLSEFTALHCDEGLATASPVLAAYRCNTPIYEQYLDLDTGGFSYIASILGQNQRAGVLYLELSKEQQRSLSNKLMPCFKAILQALNDCLNLS